MVVEIDLSVFGVEGPRSSRYRRLKRLLESGAVYRDDGVYRVNIYSPLTWRAIYARKGIDYTVYRAVNVSDGIITGVRVAGACCPKPYSDLPVYEVYVPVEKTEVFAAVIGLNNGLSVYPDTNILYRFGFSRPLVIAYPLEGFIESESMDTPYGFRVREATLEQALVDMLRGDFWFYEGIVFEIYYYIRQYIDPDKLVSIADRMGLRKRVSTLEFILSSFTGDKPLFDIDPADLIPINMLKITDILGDVID